MADSCGEADPLEVSFSNPSKSLKTGRQLDAPAIMGELMNLIDDDKSDRLEMSLHHPPRKDGLKSLGCSNQKIRRHCSLFSPFCLTSVSMADRGDKLGVSDQALDPSNHVSVQGPERGNVESLDPKTLFFAQQCENRE